VADMMESDDRMRRQVSQLREKLNSHYVPA
jgi:transcriptional regulator of met regulon